MQEARASVPKLFRFSACATSVKQAKKQFELRVISLSHNSFNPTYAGKNVFVIFFYRFCLVARIKFCLVLLRFNDPHYLFTKRVISGWECNILNINSFDIWSYYHGDDLSLCWHTSSTCNILKLIHARLLDPPRS